MSYSIGPKAVRKSEFFLLHQRPKWADFETIERKGIGHPDTIADVLASKISHSYSSYTVSHCEGLILHHQIDKLMIIGGKTKVFFGHGEFIEPICIIVAGRATFSYKGKKIPTEQIILDTIRVYFTEHFPLVNFNKDVVVENRLTGYAGPGTITTSKGAIANMFSPMKREQVKGYEKLVANDTSYCVAYAPYSALETAILSVEKYLNSGSIKEQYPWLGSDIKIMAVRNATKISITMCIPQIAKYVLSFEAYTQNLLEIGRVIDEQFEKRLKGYEVEISLNTKDDYEKMNVYITVSGASLSGDIGVVGRGNRTNGLTTSNRPMSIEGTNGKNPRYYSGFIYGVLTKKTAREIFEQTGEACTVEVVSQNGGLLKEPWRIRVQCAGDPVIIEKIVKDNFENIECITENFLNGDIINT